MVLKLSACLTRDHRDYLAPRCLSTSGISHTCLYTPTMKHHCTLAEPNFPFHVGYEANLAWQTWKEKYKCHTHCHMCMQYSIHNYADITSCFLFLPFSIFYSKLSIFKLLFILTSWLIMHMSNATYMQMCKKTVRVTCTSVLWKLSYITSATHGMDQIHFLNLCHKKYLNQG